MSEESISKTHYLNTSHWKNRFIPSEEYENISVCGRKIEEWNITEYEHLVTCKSCKKILKSK